MKALLIVDLQKDFCPGGSLAVAGGDLIVPYVNDLIKQFKDRKELVLASKDFHPEKTKHFRDQGGLWPPHCIAGTPGAGFHDDLNVSAIDKIFFKGQDNTDTGYSAFEATPNLDDYLKKHGVDSLLVVGLATDYCVSATVFNASMNGYKVSVDTKGIAAVNLKPKDGQKALEEMRTMGVEIL
jgi:nicotinamidase/pyrazinamidase